MSELRRDIFDHLFNSSEKYPALMANSGRGNSVSLSNEKYTQEGLAE
jgi:hypothetical protein